MWKKSPAIPISPAIICLSFNPDGNNAKVRSDADLLCVSGKGDDSKPAPAQSGF